MLTKSAIWEGVEMNAAEIKLDEILSIDKSGKLVTADVHVAIAHLLWETAHIDGHLHPLEQMEIVQILKETLDLTAEQAKTLHKGIGSLLGQSKLMKENLDILNRTYSHEQRQCLFSFVCRTALADRLVHKNESALVSLFSEQLELGAIESY